MRTSMQPSVVASRKTNALSRSLSGTGRDVDTEEERLVTLDSVLWLVGALGMLWAWGSEPADTSGLGRLLRVLLAAYSVPQAIASSWTLLLGFAVVCAWTVGAALARRKGARA